MTGDAANLNLIDWQLFATWTEPDRDGRSPSERCFRRAWYHLVRRLERRFQLKAESLYWCLRTEQGEQHGRWHAHTLIANLPNTLINLNACYTLAGMWMKNTRGIADVRLWNPSLDGVSYVLKLGANQYEQAKFGMGSANVTLSPAAIMRMKRVRETRATSTVFALRRLARKRALNAAESNPN